MSLPNTDPSLPTAENPIFQDNDFDRGDQSRANNQLIWQNLNYLDGRANGQDTQVAAAATEISQLQNIITTKASLLLAAYAWQTLSITTPAMPTSVFICAGNVANPLSLLLGVSSGVKIFITTDFIAFSPAYGLASASGIPVASISGNRQYVNCTYGNGLVFYSANSGASWVSVSVPSGQWISRFGNLLFNINSGGSYVLISSDNGATYTSATFPAGTYSLLDAAQTISLSFTTTLFVCGANSAIFKSSDAGLTWTASASPPTRTLKCIAASPGDAVNNSGVIICAAGELATSGTANILRSIDNGATWATIDAPQQITPIRCVFANGIFVILGANGYLLRSFDYGISWVPGRIYSPTASVVDVTIAPNGVFLAAGSFGIQQLAVSC